MMRKLWWQRGIMLLGMTLAAGACDSIEDPDAVSFRDLGAPGGLSIKDNGDGSIQLQWTGSNNEKNFEGYNIYGAKGSATDLGITDGTPIQMLDADGEAITASKDILAKFAFNPASPFALYGAATAPWLGLAAAEETEEEAEDDSDRKFSYLPIHSLNESSEPILPTCQTLKLSKGKASCEALTSEEAKKDEGDVPLNGVATYDITGLTPGLSYCFMVFSVQDGGEEISQTSSEPRCVVPKLQKAEASITFDFKTGIKFKAFDIYNLVKACSGTTCPALAAHTTDRSNDGSINASRSSGTDKALHIETYGGSSSNINLVAGHNAALRDLSEMPNGFDDARFDRISKNTPKAIFSFSGTENTVYNGGGYSLPYESYVIKKNHMYILAVADPTATKPTAIRYHYIYVNNSEDPKSNNDVVTTLDFTIRYALADEL